MGADRRALELGGLDMRWFVVAAAVVMAAGVVAWVREPAIMGYGEGPALAWLALGAVGAAVILGAGMARRARHG